MLNGFVGQESAIEPLRVEIAASRKTGRPLPNMLFLAPPGYGKTTLARELSKALKLPFEVLHCPNAQDRSTITEKIIAAQGGVLFCEEVHALRREFAEDLFTVIDDNTIMTMVPVLGPMMVPVLVEYGDGTADLEMGEHEAPTGLYEGLRQAIKPLTIIGATTDESKLPEAFLSRLSGMIIRLEEYDIRELVKIAVEYAKAEHGVRLQRRAAAHIAERCRHNPRRLKDLVDRTVARAVTDDLKVVNDTHAITALDALGIDDNGLEEPHRKMLRILTNPASRTTLAQRMGIPARNVDMYFGELTKLGFAEIDRKHQITENGRIAIERRD